MTPNPILHGPTTLLAHLQIQVRKAKQRIGYLHESHYDWPLAQANYKKWTIWHGWVKARIQEQEAAKEPDALGTAE